MAGPGPASIAAALRELAAYLELEGEGHRARAYLKAAGTIEALKDLDRFVAEGRLTELPNIGSSIAKVVAELAAGELPQRLADLRAAWPPVVIELAELPGIGAVRAGALYQALRPASLDELAAMAEAGKLAGVAGFGPKSVAKLVTAIRERDGKRVEVLLSDARGQVASWLATLRESPAVARAEVAGAVRRGLESVDQLAFVVATDDPAAVVAHLAAFPGVSAVVGEPAPTHPAGPPSRWSPRVELRLAAGPPVVVHLAGPASFGLAHLVATGDDGHVAALTAYAADRGATLAEHAASDEGAIYRALELPVVPPELRDGSDELVLAARGGLDLLVRREDIKGLVHCHTVYSDGKHTIEEMARAADALGMAYLTITDHSKSAHYAGGLDVDRLRLQWDEIARVQEGVQVRLLRGSEVDILADGALDFPDAVLDELDIVIASIHQRHQLDEAAMTARLVRAIEHPRFKIWGHPLGRMVLTRPPIPCRFDEVLDAIERSPVAIEINGDPHRLDLDPARIRRARERGARFVLSTDAHSTTALSGYLDNAIELARRARVTAGEVLNTLPADAFAHAVGPG